MDTDDATVFCCHSVRAYIREQDQEDAKYDQSCLFR